MSSLKQEFRQSQQLVMTHQLQQSIKLLQLSSAELQEYIDEEIEKNPLLAREENDAPTGPETESFAGEFAGAGASAGQGSATASAEDRSREGAEIAMSDGDYAPSESLYDESYASDWGEADGGFSAGAGAAGGGGFSEDGEAFDRIASAAAQEQTLREFLLEQIHMEMPDPTDQLVAESLVDLLDEAGYLREDTAPLAERLGVTPEAMEAMIARLQALEPVGVFARNLAECLRLQLQDMNRLDPAMELLLQNLELMGRGEIAQLRKICGVDAEDFAEMLADIRRCQPKPGQAYAHEAVTAITPDVLVRRLRGGWVVELNPDALPRVLMNRRYIGEVQTRPEDKEAKKFLNEQLANASWLLKALDARAQTILKVAQEIVKQQEKFLLHGIRFLKPMVLKDIAAAIGMHESTISRVTTAKYIATPRGTVEMKFFFTSSINSAAGASDFSSKTVMHYIKELVEAESPKKILSDDALVTLLKDRNIDVARRTITKYREEMGIPSSVVRRRLKG